MPRRSRRFSRRSATSVRSSAHEQGGLRLIASGKPTNGELKIHQDVDLYASVLDAEARAELKLRPGRHAWIQVIRGEVAVNGEELHTGDGAAVSEETALELSARSETELLIFDLA